MTESVLQVLEAELETLLGQKGEIEGKIAAVQKSIELLRPSYGTQPLKEIEARPVPPRKGRPAKSEPDYKTWPTKKEAAKALGLHTKTVEKFVKQGKLRVAKWKRPTGGPQIIVCDPVDIERIRQERESVDASPA